MKSKVLFLSLPVLLSACTSSQDSMKLSGNWRFSTDGTKWDQTIVLPGSMASNGLGDDIPSLHLGRVESWILHSLKVNIMPGIVWTVM